MYKIAILGCENTHANNFLKLIKEGHYPQIEVVGVYSHEPEAAQKLSEQFGVQVLSDYSQLQGQVDGIMVTARHGDNHYKYAKPYMDDGIPMFIDKPITCNVDEAKAFMSEAKKRGIRLCGGSTCSGMKETLALAQIAKAEEVRGGSIVCPFYPDSPHGGIWFYAQHLIEVMTTIFGEDVKEISADRQKNSLSLTARYDSFNVVGTYVEKGSYYSASVYCPKSVHTEVLDFNPDCFRHEMDAMQALLSGQEMSKSYESFIKPVAIIETMLQALQSGKWEAVPEIVIK